MLQCAWDEATHAAPSDDREGEEREPRVLPCDPVHGSLERAVRAARGCLARVWRVGQGLGQPVHERAPEPRTGLACAGLF